MLDEREEALTHDEESALSKEAMGFG